MKKKLDLCLARGLVYLTYHVKFLCDPYGCVERYGTLTDIVDKAVEVVEMKHSRMA